jgi:IS5 family transposase
MKAKHSNTGQSQFLQPDLKSQLDTRQPLYRLAEKIPWGYLEEEFGKHYSEEGRPAKPVRLMVALLILKQMHQLGDRTVVEQWVMNPYWQYFSGEEVFQWEMPVEPSDLTHFRNRIGDKGVEKVLSVSVAIHGVEASELSEVVVDTTVQEKAITYPTDSKLHLKIINRCRKLAKQEGVRVRQSYTRTVKKLVRQVRFGRRNAEGAKRARRAARKLKTIAGRLVREMEHKLRAEALNKHREDLNLYHRVLRQKKTDHQKVYSLHAPEVACIAKGKERKKYEFGAKASVAMTTGNGLIVGALSFTGNPYDGHTLEPTLQQIQCITGSMPGTAIVDRGYRGRSQIGDTEILVPDNGRKTRDSRKAFLRKKFRLRAGIEPIIGHLKARFKLTRNWLKGSVGDQINLLLAAAAFNFKKWLNQAASFWLHFLLTLHHLLLSPKTQRTF